MIQTQHNSDQINIRLSKSFSQPSLLTMGILLTLLAILTFHAFSGALSCDFVTIDDPYYVTKNIYVKEGLTWESVTWAFTSIEHSNWHPLCID